MPSEEVSDLVNGISSQKTAAAQEAIVTNHKATSENRTIESSTSSVVNGASEDLQSPVDESAINGNDSDCDSGQQWTQVDRSSNGRQSNRRGIKQTNHRDSYQPNGHQGFIPRVRSFRGSKEHGFPFRTPTTDVTVVKSRASFHEHSNSGSQQNAMKHEKNSVLGSKLSVSVSVDANGSGVHSPTGSSPSPSVSSPDPHVGGDYKDNRWSYRPQGRTVRGRRGFHMMSDTNHHSENISVSAQQNSTTTGNAVNSDHNLARGSFARPIRSPTSSINSYHNSTEEHWRRSVGSGNWRRPFNPRTSAAYNRFNGPAPHLARQYNNHQRYRASVPTEVSSPSTHPLSSPPCENQSDAEHTVVSASVPTSVVSKSELPNPPEKRTSWAAAVAAAPRTDPTGNLLPSCTDSSRTELLTFLLSQWRCFYSAVNSS